MRFAVASFSFGWVLVFGSAARAQDAAPEPPADVAPASASPADSSALVDPPSPAPAPAAPTPPAPAPPPYGGIQAGGLTPPPPVADTPASAQPKPSTEQNLDEAKKKDSGRGLEWLWL